VSFPRSTRRAGDGTCPLAVHSSATNAASRSRSRRTWLLRAFVSPMLPTAPSGALAGVQFSCQRAGPDEFSSWGFSSGGSSLVETRHSHLIKSRVNFFRRDQIPHGRLERFVPHPVLNRADVEPRPEGSRSIGRTKCLEIELRLVQSGTLGNSLTVVKHVVLAISCRRWKHELAAGARSVRLQQFNELDGIGTSRSSHRLG